MLLAPHSTEGEPSMHALVRALRLQRTIAMAGVLALAAACGGGGGDGHHLHLTTSAVNLEADHGGALPANQVVTADFDGEVIVWGIPLDSPYDDLPAWLSFTWGEPYRDEQLSYIDFTVGATTTTLTPGTYSFVMRVATGDQGGGGATYKDLTITYLVNDVAAVAAGAPPAALAAQAAPVSADPAMRVLGTAHR